MGRVFLEDYRKGDGYETHYFMCNKCRTYIAFPEHQFLLPRAQQHVRIFSKVSNVEVDEPARYYKYGSHTIADIYCVKCGYKLGFKYIEVGKNRRFILRNGYVNLMMGNFWRKCADLTVDAVTTQLIDP
ncbi:hypothetical protein ACP275_04G191400 [Erythranthe tilingii]